METIVDDESNASVSSAPVSGPLYTNSRDSEAFEIYEDDDSQNDREADDGTNAAASTSNDDEEVSLAGDSPVTPVQKVVRQRSLSNLQIQESPVPLAPGELPRGPPVHKSSIRSAPPEIPSRRSFLRPISSGEIFPDGDEEDLGDSTRRLGVFREGQEEYSEESGRRSRGDFQLQPSSSSLSGPLESAEMDANKTLQPFHHSSFHMFHNGYNGDDVDGLDGSVDAPYDKAGFFVLWGVQLPQWLSRVILQPPSVALVSSFIVRTAPCFWCSRNRIQGSSSDKAVLARLNILCMFFTTVQLVAAIWMSVLVIFLDQERAVWDFAPSFWNLNGPIFAVGILAFIINVACCCTLRVIKDVDLVGAIRYLWLVLWIIPFEIFFTISLFDYHRVTDVWIKHWWLQESLDWFRRQNCEDGTANTLCAVPINGGPDYPDETSWCIAKYQSDRCSEIRDSAQFAMNSALLTFYSAMAVWGCMLIVLLFLMVNSLERLISRPIVQKSRELNVPTWLILPTCGSAVVGAILLYSPSSLLSSSSGSDSSWIGIMYMVGAALFLIASLMGWFLSTFSIRSGSDKKNKNLAVIIFIGVMAANTVILGALFVASIIFSADLVEAPINDLARGDVACFVDRGNSCTRCDDDASPGDVCSEWSLGDVTKILQTQLKQTATISAIFILYSISVLRFGFGLRRHLSMYQIDYV